MTQIVILAGGEGSRMGGGDRLPKPLTLIGDKSIIEHLMQGFAVQGFTEFVIALGRGSELVREQMKNTQNRWDVSFANTGDNSGSAGRLRFLKDQLRDESFILAYCDGLHDVELIDCLTFHKTQGRLVSLVAINPVMPFGLVTLDSDRVTRMVEKPKMESLWINGGLFVVEPQILDMIETDRDSWERDILPKLANDHQLAGYQHTGFWKSMDTQKDALEFNVLWDEDRAMWSGANPRSIDNVDL